MRNGRIILLYIILLTLQVVAAVCLNHSTRLVLTILPALVICLPGETNIFKAMAVAFVMGFCVDFLSTGILGISSMALLPVSLLRIPMIEPYKNSTNVGSYKTIFYTIVGTALFLLIYITTDSAGMRPFLFNLWSFLISFVIDIIPGLLFILWFSSKKEAQKWN